jgi:hypothetical protein
MQYGAFLAPRIVVAGLSLNAPHTGPKMPYPAAMLEETTTDPVVADIRNFFKVELWTADDRIERMLYAGSNLHRARKIFGDQIRRRPSSILTLRQRTHVLRKWP